MYDEKTPESIKADILKEITSLNTSEGAFANILVSPVAYEMWRVYQAFNAIEPMIFVDETSGEYLHMQCALYGITPKEGKKAIAAMLFQGVDGTVIPKGKVFLTLDNLEFETLEAVTISSGTATVQAQAVEAGSIYNVNADTITRQYSGIQGLNDVTNESATGGIDPEDDTSLAQRLHEYLQKPATSGNVYHYKQWAKEVQGVGEAKVFPIWNGAGTVKVVISDQNMNPASDEIVAACANHIEDNRPIGATVTVKSAQALPINVNANVSIGAETTLDTVKTEFTKKFTEYLHSIAFKSDTVVYNRVTFIFLDIAGVTDVEFTLNNGTENIVLTSEQIPTVGTVTINESA